MLAVERDNAAMVRYLLSKGANRDIVGIIVSEVESTGGYRAEGPGSITAIDLARARGNEIIIVMLKGA